MTNVNFFVIASLCVVSAIQSMENNGREEFARKGYSEIVSYANGGEQQGSGYAHIINNYGLAGVMPDASAGVIMIPKKRRTYPKTQPDVRNYSNQSESAHNYGPSMSDSTAERLQSHIKRIEKIKKQFKSKEILVNDDAASYLSEKTANHSKAELKGFLGMISDTLRYKNLVMLDFDLAQEAVLKCNLFAAQCKASAAQGNGYNVGPVMQDFKRQYTQDMHEIKAMIAQNQQVNIMPYIYTTGIAGLLSVAMYKMNVDTKEMFASVIEENKGEFIQAVKKLSEEGGNSSFNSLKTFIAAVAGTALGKVITSEAVVETVKPVVEKIGGKVIEQCNIQ